MMYVKLLNDRATVPTVAHIGEDHGYDLYSSENVSIAPGEQVAIGTGVAIEFDPVAGARIGNRSSMAKKGLIVMGGEIDSGYRGEVTVTLRNLNLPKYSLKLIHPTPDRTHLDLVKDESATIVIRQGDKIAQLIKEPEVIKFAAEAVVELTATSRGEKGFGSSGK
jgi:dUTP pyrophosphatase